MKSPAMRLFALGLVAILAMGTGLRPAFSAFYPNCKGPLKGWRQLKDKSPHLAIIVTIHMGWDKALWWNGKAVSMTEFRKLLDASAKRNSTPFLVLDPYTIAECKDVYEIRHEMEKAMPCSKGWCGEGHGRWYD